MSMDFLKKFGVWVKWNKNPTFTRKAGKNNIKIMKKISFLKFAAKITLFFIPQWFFWKYCCFAAFHIFVSCHKRRQRFISSGNCFPDESNLYQYAFIHDLFFCAFHDEFSFVVKVTVNIVCSVIYVNCTCYRACCQCWAFCFVMSSSLCASCMRLSSFWMCHFTLFFSY